MFWYLGYRDTPLFPRLVICVTCNTVQYHQPAKNSIREPSEEEAKLRDKMIKKFPDNFVGKLGLGDRVNCKPIKLEVDERKAKMLRSVSHIKPYDVPFHLHESFQEEICDMLNAGVIEKCEVSTKWNTKAFSVPKQDGSSCRVVGDWRGVNSILRKLLHHTESCDQLLRHVPADSKVFAVIDAASGYHQLCMSEESQELLTIVTNMGRFTFKCLPNCHKAFLMQLLYGTF